MYFATICCDAKVHAFETLFRHKRDGTQYQFLLQLVTDGLMHLSNSNCLWKDTAFTFLISEQTPVQKKCTCFFVCIISTPFEPCFFNCNFMKFAAFATSWLCSVFGGKRVKYSSFPRMLELSSAIMSSPISFFMHLQGWFLISASLHRSFWATNALLLLVLFSKGNSGNRYNFRTANRTGQSSFLEGPLFLDLIWKRVAWFKISFRNSYCSFLFVL